MKLKEIGYTELIQTAPKPWKHSDPDRYDLVITDLAMPKLPG